MPIFMAAVKRKEGKSQPNLNTNKQMNRAEYIPRNNTAAERHIDSKCLTLSRLHLLPLGQAREAYGVVALIVDPKGLPLDVVDLVVA
jgi:hypothetical protein